MTDLERFRGDPQIKTGQMDGVGNHARDQASSQARKVA